MTSPTRPKIAIIGGGFAGLAAAKELRWANADVVLIDRRNHHLFQPLLYQVATAGLSPADISMPIRSVLGAHANTRVLMSEVKAIEVDSREVLLNDTKESFDYLVVATGATHSYFGKEHWQDFAPGLKSIEDATEIRRRILLAFEAAEVETDPKQRKALMNFFVIGGGPTGVELAGSIAELSYRVLSQDFRKIDPRDAQVTLIEAGSRLLSSFPSELSKNAENELKKLGVQVKLGLRVTEINEDSIRIDDQLVPTQNVVWAAGVKASLAAKWLNADHDSAGRVKVTPTLNLSTDSKIYVIGDTAHCADQEGNPLPGVAPVAIQQGKYVARRIKAEIDGTLRDQPFEYFDKGSLATIGRSSAVAAIGKIHLKGWFAWLVWGVVHIMYLVGYRNRLLVVLQWLWAYFTFQRGARLITREKDAT